MGGHSRGSELGTNEPPVIDDPPQSRLLNTRDQLVSAEGPFPGGAPDIDPPGVEHKNVAVDAEKGGPQPIEAEGVIGRHQNG